MTTEIGTLPRVTVDQIMERHPCYTRARVVELWAGREALTALDVLDLDISADHRLWAVLHVQFLPERILHEFACDQAEKALSLTDNPDPRSVAAIEVKRRWIRGEATDDELDTARDAAWDAAWAATRAAVSAAVSAAARAAARASARDAARAAAASAEAASASSWETAWDTAQSAQISDLRALIHKHFGGSGS